MQPFHKPRQNQIGSRGKVSKGNYRCNTPLNATFKNQTHFYWLEQTWAGAELIIIISVTGRSDQLLVSSVIILPSLGNWFASIPLWTWASPRHLPGAPLWPGGPVLPIVWQRVWSRLIPALHATTWRHIGPSSWMRVSTPLVRKTRLPSGTPEISLVGWCKAWPPVTWVATKMSWGRESMIRGVTVERWAPLALVSLSRTVRGWATLILRGAVQPRWGRPPLTRMWSHFGRVGWGGWPPAIKTRLSLLFHLSSVDRRPSSSSTFGIPPIGRGLVSVALAISSASGAWAVTSLTVSTTISIGSGRAQI